MWSAAACRRLVAPRLAGAGLSPSPTICETLLQAISKRTILDEKCARAAQRHPQAAALDAKNNYSRPRQKHAARESPENLSDSQAAATNQIPRQCASRCTRKASPQ